MSLLEENLVRKVQKVYYAEEFIKKNLLKITLLKIIGKIGSKLTGR